jgi:NADPH:quinone reductase-like Zn-dependent oxidoreductase
MKAERGRQVAIMSLPHSFKAMVVSEAAGGQFVREVEQKSLSELPHNEVLIEVKYSSLNYKDALSATGNKGVTRNYPHTPGIDAAGIVAESSHPAFEERDEVFVTGFDLGMNTSGGFGRYISVPAAWVLRLPGNLTLRESMAYGTAGFTAALCVLKLQTHGLTKESGGGLGDRRHRWCGKHRSWDSCQGRFPCRCHHRQDRGEGLSDSPGCGADHFACRSE